MRTAVGKERLKEPSNPNRVKLISKVKQRISGFKRLQLEINKSTEHWKTSKSPSTVKRVRSNGVNTVRLNEKPGYPTLQLGTGRIARALSESNLASASETLIQAAMTSTNTDRSDGKLDIVHPGRPQGGCLPNRRRRLNILARESCPSNPPQAPTTRGIIGSEQDPREEDCRSRVLTVTGRRLEVDEVLAPRNRGLLRSETKTSRNRVAAMGQSTSAVNGSQLADEHTEAGMPDRKRRRTAASNWSDLEIETLKVKAIQHFTGARMNWSALMAEWPFQRSIDACKAMFALNKKEWIVNDQNPSPNNNRARKRKAVSVVEGENIAKLARVSPVPDETSRGGDVESFIEDRNGSLRLDDSLESPVVDLDEFEEDEPHPSECELPCIDTIREVDIQPYWKEFIKLFSRSIRLTYRQPLKVPRPGLSIEERSIINKLVEKTMSGDYRTKDQLRRLNAGLYTAVLLVIKNRGAPKTGEHLLKLYELRKYHLRRITLLRSELHRRESGEFRNRKWFKRISPILTELDCKSLDGLRVKLRELGDKLRTIQSEIKVEEDGNQRRTTRRMGHKSVLRGDTSTETIPLDKIRSFWEGIIGVETPFDETTVSFYDPPTTLNNASVFGVSTWEAVYKRLKPWKAPGPDGIRAGFWRDIPIAKKMLTDWCEKSLEDGKVPSWLCKGKVFLLSKGGDPKEAGNYRPITCLNTCYKVLTSAMAELIQKETTHLMPATQLAMRKGVRGCVHAHILDQTITSEATDPGHEKPLAMLWVDMKKAYDSLNHKAILWTLKRMSVSEPIIRLLSDIMSRYVVCYTAFENGKTKMSDPLRVKNGIMQGDTLSPLLFCMTITCLSEWLDKNISPYISRKIDSKAPIKLGHLFYMDDLKVYTSSVKELEKTIQGLPIVARELGLELNMKKCAIRAVNCSLTGVNTGGIPILKKDETYKYLGVDQSDRTEAAVNWERITDECVTTAKKLFASQLTLRQMVDGYNQTVIAKVRFFGNCGFSSSGKLVSKLKRAKDLDCAIRKVIWNCKVRERNSSNARMYTPRECGGMGLKKASDAIEDAVIQTFCYLVTREDLKKCASFSRSQKTRVKRSIHKDFYSIVEDTKVRIEISNQQITLDGELQKSASSASRRLIAVLEKFRQAENTDDWRKCRTSSRILLHAETYPNEIALPDAYLALSKGLIGGKAARMVMGIQESSLYTGCSAKAQTKKKCRLACNYLETPEHIVSSCAYWRNTLMVTRHDAICDYLLSLLLRKCKIEKTGATSVFESTEHLIYYGVPIHILGRVRCNKPDIVHIDKISRKITIVEVSVSWYSRLVKQEQRKINKYSVNGNLPEDTPIDQYTPGNNLVKELMEDRKMPVEFIPIVVGTTGECSPNFRVNIDKLGLGPKTEVIMERIQRHAILGSHRIIMNHLAR